MIFLFLFTTIAAPVSADSIPLFIDNIDPNAHWAASILNACNSTTTYALSCTSAPNNNCNPSTATLTAGPNFMQITTPAIWSETSATITESCCLNTELASARCEQIVNANVYNDAIATTIGRNVSGEAFWVYDVEITGGAKKTAGGGSCEVRGSGGGRVTGVLGMGAVVVGGMLGVVLL